MKNDYIEKWGLQDTRQLAATATSKIYKVMWNEKPAVLKIYTSFGKIDEKGGSVALECFNGVSAVYLYRHDDNAQLLEYVGGSDLKSFVIMGEDEKATAIVGNVLNSLHSTYTGHISSELTPLKTRFRSLFKKAKQDRKQGQVSIYTKAADVAEMLLETQTNLCVLHGDIHHENIKYSDKRGWLTIDPKGLYGDRIFDAASVLCNPSGMDKFVANESRLIKNADILAQILQIDVNRLLAFTFAYAGLSASWSLEDNENPSLALKIAAITESHCST